MSGAFGASGLETLDLPDVSSLRPGLNHVVLDGAPDGLFPGRMLPVRLAADAQPRTSVIVAEAQSFDWDELPALYFSRHHYCKRSKRDVARELSREHPQGWGPRVTWLWFVVAGWGRASEVSAKRSFWNERYAGSELVWGADPNRFVAEALRDVVPTGRALELGCGEGRNTIWLAKRGWRATGIDYSHIAIERARRLSTGRGVRVRFLEGDVTTWAPEPGAYALVLVAYLQLPQSDMHKVWIAAASALEPGGKLFGIGHARRNLTEGSGGPRDADVLWDPDAIAEELRGIGLRIDEAEHVLRPTGDDPERPAIDVRIRARRD